MKTSRKEKLIREGADPAWFDPDDEEAVEIVQELRSPDDGLEEITARRRRPKRK